MGRFALAGLGALSLAITGCGGGGGSTAPGATAPGATVRGHIAAPMTIHLSSAAFANGARIPARYACTGADVSPPLTWSRPPASAKELALLMIDLNAPGGPFTHWALAGIPPTTRDLRAGEAPPGAVAGRNGFGKTG
ncbi:MAG: YbhB/YbcL family Raf kinase inhibitor-like protein, partial [Solirubrobacteraceae bacterium]